MTTLQKFCALPNNGSFIVYDDINKTFGRCFLWTSISYVCYLIFAVQCAYLLGVSKSFSSKRTSFFATLASIISMLTAFSSLIEVILCYALHDHEEHPPAYVLAKGIIFTAWTLSFLLQNKVSSITREKKQNNKYMLISLLLVIFSSSMQLQYVVATNSYSDKFQVHYVGSIVDFTLSIVYFFTCIGIGLSKVTSVQSYDTLEEETSSIHGKEMYLGPSEVTKNVLSKLVYWWSDSLLTKGTKKQLKEPEDLFFLPDSLNTNKMKETMKNKLHEEKERLLNGMTSDERFEHNIKRKPLDFSLFKVLNQCFGRKFYPIAIFKLLSNICQLVQPTLVNLLVTFVSDRTEPLEHGFYYALGFLLTTLASVVFDIQYRYRMMSSNLRIRAALITVIYEKALLIRSSSLSKLSTGKIVNLMSSDTDRVRNYCNNFHECWSVPFQLIVCLYLLYNEVDAAVLSTIAYCILIVPIAQRLSKKVKEFRMKVFRQKDKRIKLMCEILFGIRIIKYNAWEDHFTEKVNEARDSELKYIFITKNLIGAVICIWGMSVSVISILTIGTYVLMGHTLTAAKVFTCMAIINRLVNPLNMFSWNLNALIDAWVSLKRIQNYLALPEMNLNEYYTKGAKNSTSTAVQLTDGCFCWKLKDEPKETEFEVTGCCCCKRRKVKETPRPAATEQVKMFELKNVSLSLKKGQFVGITGKVGSGKSSLFASITAELEKNGGEVFLSEQLNGIAYVTQEPWIQHMSIRDNILFGQPFDEERYNNVLHACALYDDINLFTAGDLTEVGESGVNLSGGQKARVALARAVYQDKDMYLLDDPIAAVDAHVAKHLYKYCINGFLKDKTRILCTHHTSYLQQCDHVIMMQEGTILDQGPPDEVLKDVDIVDFDDDPESEAGEKDEEKREMKGNFEKNAKDGKLVEEEEKRIGSVSSSVYKLYWNAFGTWVAISVILSIILRQAGKNVQDWWLSYWVSNQDTTANVHKKFQYDYDYYYEQMYGGMSSSDEYYLSVYSYIVIGYLVFVALRAFLHAYGGTRASRVLHQKILGAVMSTPISFFDITPVGRIVNRFSTDIGDIDGPLPQVLSRFMVQIASLVGTIILTCYSLPWFAIFLVPLGVLYYYIQKVYRQTSRELKRISSVSRSPIYEHFTETLTGYIVIRAFRESKRFIYENDSKLDKSQRSEYNEQLASMWLTLRLDLIGVLMVTLISLLAVVEHHFGGIDAGLVGLAITYSIQITPVLGGLLTVFTETEKQMVRVERVSQYIEDTPQETHKSKNVSERWPHTGEITIDRIYFRYRENLPYALQDVSLEVRAGEKIGICGRTGSGKSTMMKVLFNIVDLSSGSIVIDGIDINNIDHTILRSRMSIIPQDPFLFNDTISKNLDPAESYPTHEMMDVIEKCHLTQLVQDLGGLQGKVGERGSNLSAGQKQLLCLARALLKKSKIICIDEATASVDLETDKLIQVTIREEFASNTVLTIAHRMNTIIDSDRVLVMEAGRILEFASPITLLNDTTSEFYSLVNENSSSK